MRTIVNTNRQVFPDNLTTARTHLGSVAWINRDTRPASIFCFVGRVLPKLTPGSIRDAFVHAAPVAILHVLNVQVLEGDNLKFVYKSFAQFMRKVFAAVGNTLMNMVNDATVFTILMCAPRTLAQSALRLGKRLLVFAKWARIGNVLAGRKGSEMGQTNIYSHNFWRWWQWNRLNDTRETGIPIVQSISANDKCLDFAFNGTVEPDLDCAYFRKTQSDIILQGESALRIGERIIAIFPMKARIARLLFGFHAAEKCLKREVNANTGVLQGLGVGIKQKWMLSLPIGQHLHGVIA